MRSKVVPGSKVGACRPWDAPDVEASAADSLREAEGSQAHLLTARQLDDLQARAHAEAFEQGRREGVAAGQDEIATQVRRLDQLMGALEKPFRDLDAQVEHELLALAIAVARQLVRRELKLDPSHIVGVVREALEMLPVAAREVRLRLHPEDAVLVREALLGHDGERGWRIVEDPTMSRGGCRVTTATSQIDARLETRLGAIVSSLMGSERAADDDGS